MTCTKLSFQFVFDTHPNAQRFECVQRKKESGSCVNLAADKEVHVRRCLTKNPQVH